MSVRIEWGKSKRWVIKIGSALLTDDGKGLDHEAIRGWVAQIAKLRQQGTEVVLVSSGSVAEGVSRLGLKERPVALHQLQAAAAVGQMGLVQFYEQCFHQHDMHTAQILLTHEDLASRKRYLNTQSTLNALLNYNVVPIINENDTVATEELKFGDNDTLAGMVANLLDACLLVILTDQEGLYDDNPRQNPCAKLISTGRSGDAELESFASGSGNLGRGGMSTKLLAAKLAARSGAATIIASGRADNTLIRIAAGDKVGTLLLPAVAPLAARKRWLVGQLKSAGEVILDKGAVAVLRNSGCSLLPVGVIAVKGNFKRGELVLCKDEAGIEVARGLVNYNAEEAQAIMGRSSDEIASVIGYVDEEELIHRDNMVLV